MSAKRQKRHWPITFAQIMVAAGLLLVILANSSAEVPDQWVPLSTLAYQSPESALEQVEQLNMDQQDTDPWLNIVAATALYYLNQFSESQSRLIQAELQLEDQPSSHAQVIVQRLMGQNYYRMGAMDQAMRQALKAERMAGELMLSDEQAQTRNLIAAVHLRSGEHSLALEAFKQALVYFEQIQSLPDIAKLNNNLAATYIEQGQPDMAEAHLMTALRAAEELNRPSTKIAALVNLVEQRTNQGRFKDAESALGQCLQTARNSNQSGSEVWCLESGIELYERNGQPGRAIALSYQAHEMAKSQQMMQSTINIGERLARLLANSGEHESAWNISTQNLADLKQIRDEVVRLKLEEVNALNEVELTRADLRHARQENQIQHERQVWMWMGFAVLTPLLGIALFLLRSKQRVLSELSLEQQRTEAALVEMEKAKEENERLAKTDPLTGLNNRRELMGLIRQICHGRQHTGVDENPAVLLMLDIDRFKGINDHFGHNAGDYVLVEVARLLTVHFSEAAGISRWGGEEFMVLLVNGSVDEAARAAESFCQLLRDVTLQFEDQQIAVTVSIGVCQYQDGDRSEQWIKQVDEAMYQSKESGRNRVTCILR